MGQDVLIKSYGPNGLYDLVIEDGDFKSADGFETSIPVSLFTDARAPVSIVQNSRNRRGFLGNILTIDENYELGSLLWTFDQSRIIQETENRAKTEVRKAFNWMFVDRVITSLNVELESSQRNFLIFLNFNSIENAIDRFVTLWRITDMSQLPTV